MQSDLRLVGVEVAANHSQRPNGNLNGNHRRGQQDGQLRNEIRIDEGEIKNYVDVVVRQSVEDGLNKYQDQEADQLCGAKRYEQNQGRLDTFSGSYNLKLQTKAGRVTLQVPLLRTLPFETPIIERYKRRESSLEEALL